MHSATHINAFRNFRDEVSVPYATDGAYNFIIFIDRNRIAHDKLICDRVHEWIADVFLTIQRSFNISSVSKVHRFTRFLRNVWITVFTIISDVYIFSIALFCNGYELLTFFFCRKLVLIDHRKLCKITGKIKFSWIADANVQRGIFSNKWNRFSYRIFKRTIGNIMHNDSLNYITDNNKSDDHSKQFYFQWNFSLHIISSVYIIVLNITEFKIPGLLKVKKILILLNQDLKYEWEKNGFNEMKIHRFSSRI